MGVPANPVQRSRIATPALCLATVFALATSCKARDGESCAKPSECAAGLTCIDLSCQHPAKISDTEPRPTTAPKTTSESDAVKQATEQQGKELRDKIAQIKELQELIAGANSPEEIEQLSRRLRKAKGGVAPEGTGKAAPKKCDPRDPLCSF